MTDKFGAAVFLIAWSEALPLVPHGGEGGPALSSRIKRTFVMRLTTPLAEGNDPFTISLERKLKSRTVEQLVIGMHWEALSPLNIRTHALFSTKLSSPPRSNVPTLGTVFSTRDNPLTQLSAWLIRQAFCARGSVTQRGKGRTPGRYREGLRRTISIPGLPAFHGEWLPCRSNRGSHFSLLHR